MTPTLSELIRRGFALVPVRSGSKAPIGAGWNQKANTITDVADIGLLEGRNVGLAHAYSTPVTCALDVDHPELVPEAVTTLLKNHLKYGCVQVLGGAEGRRKLIFQVEKPFVSIISDTSQGFALRCLTSDGLTMQDVIAGERPNGGSFVLDWPEHLAELPKLSQAFVDSLAGTRKLSTVKKDYSNIVEIVEPQTISDLRRALQMLDPDDRQSWINAGMGLKILGKEGWNLWSQWSAQSDKWMDGKDDPYKTWDSFAPVGGLHWKWIFSEAQKKGWRNEFNPEKVDSFEVLKERAAERPVSTSIFRTHDETKLLPRSWLVHTVMPRRGVAQIFGEPGAGKTYFVLEMLLSASAGLPFGTLKTHCPGLALYLAAEGELASRVTAWEKFHGRKAAATFRYAHFARDVSTPAGKEHVVANIEAAMAESGKKLSVLVIDTLTASAPSADENDKKGMGPLLSFFRQIAVEYECIVLFVHHCGKDTTRGARGWSGLRGDVDAEITLSPSPGSSLACDFVVSKMRNGTTGTHGVFDLKTQKIGIGRDYDELADPNEAIYSLVAVMREIHPPKREKHV